MLARSRNLRESDRSLGRLGIGRKIAKIHCELEKEQRQRLSSPIDRLPSHLQIARASFEACTIGRRVREKKAMSDGETLWKALAIT